MEYEIHYKYYIGSVADASDISQAFHAGGTVSYQGYHGLSEGNISPCIGSALYTNVLQHRQQYYVTRFAQDYDRTSLETAKTYDQTVMGMQYQGKSVTEAQNMAAMSVKGKVRCKKVLEFLK